MIIFQKHIRSFPALRFSEIKPEGADFSRIMEKVVNLATNLYDMKAFAISKIYTSTDKKHYFYLYLRLPKNDVDKVIGKVDKAFSSYRSIEIVYYPKAQLEDLISIESVLNKPSKGVSFQVAPQKPTKKRRARFVPQNTDSGSKKSIRVDINMEDIEDFLAYLETREPNRQIRERYKEAIKSMYNNGWNQYIHSTFIDNKRYFVNPKDIRVFVNGIESNDFKISAKEYQESIELYLTYRRAKKYNSPRYNVPKDAPLTPVIKERTNQSKQEETENNEGKKIYANISHLQSWESLKNEKSRNEDADEATVYYEGGEAGSRKSATIQASSITEDESSVNISINLDTLSQTEPQGEDYIFPEDIEGEVPVDYDEKMVSISEDSDNDQEEGEINQFVEVTDAIDNEVVVPADNKTVSNNRVGKKESLLNYLLAPYKSLIHFIVNLFSSKNG